MNENALMPKQRTWGEAAKNALMTGADYAGRGLALADLYSGGMLISVAGLNPFGSYNALMEARDRALEGVPRDFKAAASEPINPLALGMAIAPKIRGYHASTKDFGKFDTAFAGTNEGSDFGSSLTFARNPKTAEAWATNMVERTEKKPAIRYEVDIDTTKAPVLDLSLPYEQQSEAGKRILDANAARIRNEWGYDRGAMTFGGQPFNEALPEHRAAAILNQQYEAGATAEAMRARALQAIDQTLQAGGLTRAQAAELHATRQVIANGREAPFDLFQQGRPMQEYVRPRTPLDFGAIADSDEIHVLRDNIIDIVRKMNEQPDG